MPTILSSRILATNDEQFIDSTPQGTSTFPIEALPYRIQIGPNGILVANDCFLILQKLNRTLVGDPYWKFKINTHKVTRAKTNAVIGTFLPQSFGFLNPSHKNKRHYRVRFDCLTISNIEDNVTHYSLEELLSKANEILLLLKTRGAKTKQYTKGSIASGLLRASKHYNKDRRPAPGFINDLARPLLPGNYYSLSVDKGDTRERVTYLDQSAAHHYAALELSIPHPNYIRARGNDRTLDGTWIKPGPLMDKFRERHYGLIAAQVSIGSTNRKNHHLLPEWATKPGRKVIYFYSNEWSYFDEWQHLTLEFIVAAWTATVKDTLIKDHARFSISYLKTLTPEAKKVVKPLLLAGYGILASRPSKPFTSYYPPKQGHEPITIPGMLVREVTISPSVYQPQLRHVIARGMIEAETRKRSLQFAKHLARIGIVTYQVYVDGLLVDGKKAMPFMPEGWSVQHYLNHVHFLHVNAFASPSLSKLPGIPRLDELRRRSAREPFTLKG